MPGIIKQVKRNKRKSISSQGIIELSSEDSIVSLLNMYSMKEKQTKAFHREVPLKNSHSHQELNSVPSNLQSSMHQKSSGHRKGPLAQWEEQQIKSGDKSPGYQSPEIVSGASNTYDNKDSPSDSSIYLLDTHSSFPQGQDRESESFEGVPVHQSSSSIGEHGEDSQSKEYISNTPHSAEYNSIPRNVEDKSRAERYAKADKMQEQDDNLLDGETEIQLKNEVIMLRESNEKLQHELISLGYEYEKIYKFVTLKMKEKTFNISNEFLMKDKFYNASSNASTQDIPPPQQDSIQAAEIYQKNLAAMKQQSDERFRIQESIIKSLEEKLNSKEATIQELVENSQLMEQSLHKYLKENEKYIKENETLTTDYNMIKQQLEKLEGMMAKKDHLLEEYRAENESAEEHYKLQMKRRDAALNDIRKILVKDLKKKQEMQLENVAPRLNGDGIRIRSMQAPNIRLGKLEENFDTPNINYKSSTEIRLGQLSSSENYVNHLSSEIKAILAKRDYWKRRVKGLELKLKHLETLGKTDKQKAAQLDTTIRKVEQQSQMILSLTEQLKHFKNVLKEKLTSSPRSNDPLNDPTHSSTYQDALNSTIVDERSSNSNLRRMTDSSLSRMKEAEIGNGKSGLPPVKLDTSPLANSRRSSFNDVKSSKWDFMKRLEAEQVSMVTIHNVGLELPNIDPRGLRSAPASEDVRESFLPTFKTNSRSIDANRTKVKWRAKFRSKYVSSKSVDS